VKLFSVFLFVGLMATRLFSCASSNKPVANPAKPASATQITLPGTEWLLTDLAGTPALSGGKATADDHRASEPVARAVTCDTSCFGKGQDGAAGFHAHGVCGR
jgi:hypothetical protein